MMMATDLGIALPTGPQGSKGTKAQLQLQLASDSNFHSTANWFSTICTTLIRADHKVTRGRTDEHGPEEHDHASHAV